MASDGSLVFEMTADGDVVFDACTGHYELQDGGKIDINEGDCDGPALSTGFYEFTIDEGLTLSQRFKFASPGYSGMSWRQEENGYEIELSSGGIRIVGGDDCYGLMEATGADFTTIDWSSCQGGERWLASAGYKFTFVGQELFLTRRFEKF
jgi:hypothetical protein